MAARGARAVMKAMRCSTCSCRNTTSASGTWTLRADLAQGGGSRFRTETRAVATDREARRKFRTYWSFLSPGIILVRAAMVPQLRDACDRAWHLEGDDFYPEPQALFTHAVTIAAPVRDVWPWLLQMGCQRGGPKAPRASRSCASSPSARSSCGA
jgi:hypothetical protein